MLMKAPAKQLKASSLRLIFISSLLLGSWFVLVKLTHAPSFILPSPEAVFIKLWQIRTLLLSHLLITLIEIFGGLVIGIFLGICLAICMQLFRPIRLWLLPVLLFSQAIPVFALAPILVLWLGYGMTSKIMMAALIIFFPILMTCFDGLRHTPQETLNLAKTIGAKPWQIVLRIRLPFALPVMASGIRMAVVVAPIGAIISEWVGSSAGLGYFMLLANARMQVTEMFAALFMLSLLSIVFYYLTDQLLKKAIPWNSEQH